MGRSVTSMPSSRDISFSQIYDLAEKLIQIRLEFVFLLKDFVLSKLHIVFNVFTT